jgi:hypothetical protein
LNWANPVKTYLDLYLILFKLKGKPIRLIIRAARLYRGILAPILVEAPKRAVKFASNDQYTRIAYSLYGTRNLPNVVYIACGVSAGITEAFAVVSMELIKVRMQDSKKVGQYGSVLDCLVKTIKIEGIRGMFKGLEATIFRHAAWNGGYFGSINPTKRALKEFVVFPTLKIFRVLMERLEISWLVQWPA